MKIHGVEEYVRRFFWGTNFNPMPEYPSLQDPDSAKQQLNEDDIDRFSGNFEAHFRADESHDKLNGTKTLIPLAEIPKVMGGKTVAGLYINYGLSGKTFIPILELMYDVGHGDLDIIDDSAHIMLAAPLGLTNVAEKERSDRVEEYRTRIRIKRTVTSNFSGLRRVNGTPVEGTNEPDPVSMAYRYGDKLNKLIAHNPVGDPRLVITCISCNMVYGDLIGFMPQPEYRHLLSLHIASGTKDQLKPGPRGPSYKDRGLDLGNACPPNCPPKRTQWP